MMISQPAGAEDLSPVCRLCGAAGEEDQVAVIAQAGPVWRVMRGGAAWGDRAEGEGQKRG